MLVKSGDAAKCSRLQLPDDGINVKRFDRPKKYLGIIFKSIKPIFGQSKRVHGKISGNMACPKSLYGSRVVRYLYQSKTQLNVFIQPLLDLDFKEKNCAIFFHLYVMQLFSVYATVAHLICTLRTGIERYPVKSTQIFMGCTLIFLGCHHTLIFLGHIFSF